MMDLNDVKAGKYQLVALRWDQITSKPTEPLDYIRHRKGAIVDLDIDDARRLVAAGAVVKPGQLEKDAAEQARAIAERAAADYQAILAGLPDDVRAEVAPDTVAQEPKGWWGDGEEPTTIEAILEAAGDDATRIAAALQAEESAAKPRVTLVEQLRARVESGTT